MRKTIRVLIVDDVPMIREGIRSILDEQHGFDCVGETSAVSNALSLSQTHQPEVLLLSLDISELSLPEVMASLQQFCPQTQVLAISQSISNALKHRLVAEGAKGCILQNETKKHILSALHTVAQGKLWFSQPILQKLLENEPHADNLALKTGLTQREVELLKLLTRGWSNAQIAELLNITERTVKFHTGNIYHKLEISSRAQAISWAWQHGLGDIP